jgi:arginase
MLNAAPPSQDPLRLLGVPFDLGASLRGAALGPAVFRIAGLAAHLGELGHSVIDHGDVTLAQAQALASGAESGLGKHDRAILAWSRAIHEQALALFRAGGTPLFMGGDHSLSMGTVSAAAEHARAQGRRPVLLWLDAHADYNTPDTSPSGNMHGMSVAFLTGDESLRAVLPGWGPALAPQDVHLFGLRSVDREERAELAADGLSCMDMRRIDEFGVSALIRQVLAGLDPATTHLHVSLDLDMLDPAIAPGVGTPVEGGMSYREAHLIMELLHESGLVRSVDVVELNPYLDERGRTARLAVDLIGSLFGRTVLARGQGAG